MIEGNNHEYAQSSNVRRQPNIVDVAKHAAVSSKTVSNVLHGRSNVKSETRERVLKSIRELGYHPNLISRQLRYGKSNTIMLAVPELRNTYFSTLAHEVMTYAQQMNYTVLITETMGDSQREEAALSGLSSCTVDGVILSTLALTGKEAWAKRTGMPVVLLGEQVGESTITHVAINNRQSGQDVANHLIERGCHKLVFLGADAHVNIGTGWSRLQGCLDVVKSNDQVTITAKPMDYTYEDGAKAILEFMQNEEHYDALICGNDALALGAMWELRMHGVRVPQDVCVIGWDGSTEGKYANPSLTTVEIDIRQVAKTAVDAVLSTVKTGDAAGELLVDYRLLARESTRR